MKFIFLLSIFIFVGCTIKNPHISEYRVLTMHNSDSYHSNGCKDKSLKVGKVFSSSLLSSQRMRYIKDEYKEFSFSESQWAQSPNQAISQEILKSVKGSNLFRSVNSFKSRSKSDLILESSVEEFIQYFNKDDSKSYVKVTISVSLVDISLGVVIGETTIKKVLSTDTIDANGGVKALNKALSNVLDENLEWLSGVCR